MFLLNLLSRFAYSLLYNRNAIRILSYNHLFFHPHHYNQWSQLKAKYILCLGFCAIIPQLEFHLYIQYSFAQPAINILLITPRFKYFNWSSESFVAFEANLSDKLMYIWMTIDETYITFLGVHLVLFHKNTV